MATSAPPLSFGQQIQQAVSTIDGIGMSFPATNADGSPNQQAQNDAVAGAFAALQAAGLQVNIPGIDPAKLVTLVEALIPVINAYKKATNRPTL